MSTGSRGVLALFLSLWLWGFGFAQPIRIVSYNVENLFDPGVEAQNPDSSFTPVGAKLWTSERLDAKVRLISKALIAVGGWASADIVGLCEVENRAVLKRLLYDTPLRGQGYRVVHRDSPDRRGIDVALLYRQSAVSLLASCWFPVCVDTVEQRYSRDLLYARFLVRGQDTLHVLMCHWPSKFGGGAEQRGRRGIAALRTRAIVDSILLVDSSAKLVAMGDFNSPIHSSVFSALTGGKAETPGLRLCPMVSEHGVLLGSYKYRGHAESIDHFFLSPSLLGGRGLRARLPSRICDAPILLEADKSYGGMRPRRTYHGNRYHGGISDHLPIVLILERGK